MKINITSYGIGIIGKKNDLVLYRTVDENIVLSASSNDYKETFRGNSPDEIERRIHNDLYKLMRRLSDSSEFNNFLFANIISLYPNDRSDVLKLEKKGDEISLELKKLKNNNTVKTGRIEIIKQNELFLEFFKSLLEDSLYVKNNKKLIK